MTGRRRRPRGAPLSTAGAAPTRLLGMDLRIRQLNLRTKLLLTMLSLLVLSIPTLFFLHLYSEQRLMSQLHEYTEDLSTAIEVFQEQPVGEGDPQVVLKAYMDKLGQLGVKDISITDSAEVQASTNPQNVGRRLVRSSKRRGPKEFVIKGVLGEESGPPGSQTTTTLTLPIVLGDRRVGYLRVTRYLADFSALSREALLSLGLATLGAVASRVLALRGRPLGYLLTTRYLDDFSALSREALLSRVLATLGVFALGILASLYLS